MLIFGYGKEFIFKERGFFEISQNKNPSKITHHTVASYCVSWLIITSVNIATPYSYGIKYYMVCMIYIMTGTRGNVLYGLSHILLYYIIKYASM